ncbi:uracil-DNA glycosylase family protein [Aquimarina hainanensis]|uniref:Uracil-DNA glycosylase family protein n=1 Tax=Aquimarina hainanensis TaxID=1578017 RepID=A0ABW5N9A5_9FLAO|nr:uracil-DNA glycosylase family protein [Aquimarina sp. TRL1]QKX03474.1 uracil-DNA glycosylase family protein [Aquimarina sp. TRL1]
MFIHTHPYEPFIPEGTTKLIVGTLPPPRFTTGDLNDKDVDFCYGSSNGLLWPVLDRIFQLGLRYETTEAAAMQRKQFLLSKNIGVCDIVQSCKRDKVDASDLGMQEVILRDLIGYLKKHKTIDTLIFTGGNSKNGPEYFFRKHLKTYGIPLTVVSDIVPRIHRFQLGRASKKQGNNRYIKTVSLTAPSGAANRSIGSLPLYKMLKKENPNFNTLDFRVMQYREFF